MRLIISYSSKREFITTNRQYFTLATTGRPMFLTTRKSRRILLYQGFTYSRVNPGQYCCSRRLVLKCKAKIKLDEINTVILDEELTHNHEPPMFHISKDREYIPIT